MIIWDDYKYGKELLSQGHLNTKKWQYKELKALGFYLLCEAYDITQIKSLMEQICNEDIRYLTTKQKDEIFSRLIVQCQTESFAKDVCVSIYSEEIEKIKLLQHREAEQLIFTMLIYKKWLDAISVKQDSTYYPWFACMKQDIFTEAKLNRLNSLNKQLLLNQLVQKGCLNSEVKKLSRKDQRREQIEKKQMWSIPFLCQQGRTALTVHNYTDLCQHYHSYQSSRGFTCQRCSGSFERQSNRQLICPSCRRQKAIERRKSNYQKQKLYPLENRCTP